MPATPETPPPSVVCVGHATLDAVFAVPRLPVPDERVPASAGVLAGGGPAATAAVTLARQGVPVAFAGRVGDDRAGMLIREGLAAEGVDVSLLATTQGPSPVTAVLVDPDGGRALVPAPANPASIELTGDLVERLRRGTWLHVDHLGAGILPAVRDAGLEARISVDGGNPIHGLSLDGVALYAPTEPALLDHTRAATLEDALDAALAEGARLVVATRGAHGSIAAWLDADGRRRSVESAAVPVRSLVSTLGAGDVFHGALLAALVEDQAVPEALAFAGAAAAASTRALDGRSAIPDRAAVEAVLAAGEVR